MILATRNLLTAFQRCDIQPEVSFMNYKSAHVSKVYGSDHCPVFADISISVSSLHREPPLLCTKYRPQFKARQLSLNQFLRFKEPAHHFRFVPRVSVKIESELRNCSSAHRSPKKRKITNYFSCITTKGSALLFAITTSASSKPSI